MKRILILLTIILSCFCNLPAQGNKIDYFSIGYNDAVNRKVFDSQYNIENLNKSVENLSSNGQSAFLKNAESYNLGYIYGLCKILNLNYDDDFLNFKSVQDNLQNVGKVIANESDYDWFNSIGVVQGTSKDGKVASIEIRIGYEKGDSETGSMISAKTVDIKTVLRRFLNSKVAEDLQNTANDAVFGIEIKNLINEKLGAEKNVSVVIIKQKTVY